LSGFLRALDLHFSECALRNTRTKENSVEKNKNGVPGAEFGQHCLFYPVHEDSEGKNTGVGCHVLLQGICPTQGLNPGLPHCRWVLYYLSHWRLARPKICRVSWWAGDSGSPRVTAEV